MQRKTIWSARDLSPLSPRATCRTPHLENVVDRETCDKSHTGKAATSRAHSKLFLSFILFCITFIGSPALSYSQSFEKPPHISQEVWNDCSEYFIPFNHPAKKTLDEIFGAIPRAIHSSKSLRKAGFKNTKPGEWSGTIIAKHKKLKGYLVKLFTDDQTSYVDWEKLMQRARGARSAQATIHANGWDSLFKVPQKWIYPLPEASAQQKNFILLVEDMHLVSEVDNLLKWKNETLPEKTLKAIYQLLDLEGLNDSVYAFNLPFAKDGRIALIDTEYHHNWPIPYQRLCQYLSKKNSQYWVSLTSGQ